ncbi:MAG: glycosyltransferase family 4 protein [Methylococcales bacterium]|nr:glycosyltransferase family 4 protein [Methylococcales bacterium]
MSANENEIIIATIMRPSGETGVQAHFNCFRDFLSSRQYRPRLITPFSSPGALVYPLFAVRKILDKLSGPASVWWYRYWHAFFLRMALKKYLKNGAACVVYAQCPVSADAALRARVSARQRVVMVVHFNISQADEWAGKGRIAEGGSFYQAIRDFEARVLPKLDGLVFVSAFMQRELIKRIPALAGVSAAIVPNFLPDPGETGTQNSDADLISIGTLEARKNQRYLLEILVALRERGVTLRLSIIGDGPDRAMLEAAACALKVDELVHFAGFVADAAEWIALHKACIHVASIENLPVTLLEAIARGRPLFVAAVGGVPEILASGNLGLALPLDDAATAAELIAGAINDPEWMAAAGLAARQSYLGNYSSDVCGERLLGFLLSTNPEK